MFANKQLLEYFNTSKNNIICVEIAKVLWYEFFSIYVKFQGKNIYSTCTGEAVKTYEAAMEVLRKRKEGMKLNLPPKLV
jgi:hypothetical protein